MSCFSVELEDPSKDHFMLFQIARVTCEELPSDVRERSRAGEVARVANCVTFIPSLNLILDDVANSNCVGSRLGAQVTR
jgi:hypothetical protein